MRSTRAGHLIGIGPLDDDLDFSIAALDLG
jgi:hypothetical protein